MVGRKIGSEEQKHIRVKGTARAVHICGKVGDEPTRADLCKIENKDKQFAKEKIRLFSFSLIILIKFPWTRRNADNVYHSCTTLRQNKRREVIWQSKCLERSSRARPRERLISLELSEIEPSGRGRLAKSFSRSGRKSSSRIRRGERNEITKEEKSKKKEESKQKMRRKDGSQE